MDPLSGPFLASALLLVAAGGAKLVDPLPLVRALRSARLPASRSLVRGFALVEVVLGLAAALAGSRLAAVGVAASYAAFTAFVVLARRRGGVLASCGCFGKADTPPTTTHVLTTGSLAVVAAAVDATARQPPGPAERPAWWRPAAACRHGRRGRHRLPGPVPAAHAGGHPMTALVVALAVAVLLLSVLVAGLLRSHAEILKALHELGAGLELDRASGPVPVTIDGVRTPRTGVSSTPDALSGVTLDGESIAVSLTSGKPTLLAFLSSGCLTCQAFWEAFADPQLAVPGDARLVVVSKSLDEESPSALAKRAPGAVELMASSQAWESLQVPGSPYFVLVDGHGRVVGEGSAATWPAVSTLMGQAHDDDGHRTREQRDDAALAAAGITLGDPSLHGGS